MMKFTSIKSLKLHYNQNVETNREGEKEKKENRNEKCSHDDANEMSFLVFYYVHRENIMRANIAIGTAATDYYDRMGAKSISFTD